MKKSRILKLAALSAIVLAGLYLAANFVFTRLASAAIHKTYQAMAATEFQCPDGSEAQLERYGLLGWSRYCKRGATKQGPWEAWEGSALSIQGEMSNGRPAGTWIYYDEHGQVERTVEQP